MNGAVKPELGRRAWLVGAAAALGCRGRSADHPSASLFVDTDLSNYWQAVDEYERSGDPVAFQRSYLDQASRGLAMFDRVAIHGAKNLAAAVDRAPGYYAGLSQLTSALSSQYAQFVADLERFEALFPSAKFVPTYFVIGAMTTGGYASKVGVLMGLDIFGAGLPAARQELPDLADRYLREWAEVRRVLVHEYVHVQQPISRSRGLLADALQEGGCDFVTTLVLGEPPTTANYRFGRENEARVWEAFNRDMNDSARPDRWINNGAGDEDWPGDLAYFVGHQICRAYYERHPDKARAIRDIVRATHPKRVFAGSRYDP